MNGRNERSIGPLPSDEELLRDLVLGERDPSEPLVQRAFEASPALRAEWAELRASGGGLDALRALEADVLAELGHDQGRRPGEGGVPRDWDERARASLRGLAASVPLRPRRTPRRWAPLVAAVSAVAASLLVTLFVLRERGADPASTGGETYLGSPSEAPQLREPLGHLERDALGVFRWAYAPGAPWEGSCLVIVYDAVGDELARSGPVPRPTSGDDWRWTPTAKQLEALRAADGFLWQVSAEATVGFSASSSLGSVSWR